jgi:predicted RNase H-like nuclease
MRYHAKHIKSSAYSDFLLLIIFSEIKKNTFSVFSFPNRGKIYSKTTFHDARQGDRAFSIYAILNQVFHFQKYLLNV